MQAIKQMNMNWGWAAHLINEAAPFCIADMEVCVQGQISIGVLLLLHSPVTVSLKWNPLNLEPNWVI